MADTSQLDAEFAALMDHIASTPSTQSGYMRGGHDNYTPLDAKNADLASNHSIPTGYIPRATPFGVPVSYNPHTPATEMVVVDAITKERIVLSIGDGPNSLSKADTEETYAVVRKMAAARGIHDHVRLAPLAMKALQLRLQAKIAAEQRRSQHVTPQAASTPWQPPRPVSVAPPSSLVGMSLGVIGTADVAQAAAHAAFAMQAAEQQGAVTQPGAAAPASPPVAAAPVARDFPPPKRLTVVLQGVGQFETYWTEIVDDVENGTLTLVFDASRDLSYWEPPTTYTQPFAVQEAGSPVKLLVELTGARTRVGSSIIHILRVRNRA